MESLQSSQRRQVGYAGLPEVQGLESLQSRQGRQVRQLRGLSVVIPVELSCLGGLTLPRYSPLSFANPPKLAGSSRNARSRDPGSPLRSSELPRSAAPLPPGYVPTCLNLSNPRGSAPCGEPRGGESRRGNLGNETRSAKTAPASSRRLPRCRRRASRGGGARRRAPASAFFGRSSALADPASALPGRSSALLVRFSIYPGRTYSFPHGSGVNLP